MKILEFIILSLTILGMISILLVIFHVLSIFIGILLMMICVLLIELIEKLCLESEDEYVN